ncbi:X-Pro dipeptidyl-peptidase (S15 family) [Nocardia amikacinitolerans]|nr:X-Pro dipeptidyl-peptidase (S15 family) [Nocardia amikacinitolerans]
MVEPLTSAAGAPPDARFDIGPERYPKLHAAVTVPIPMSDGAVLSADVLRPGDRSGPTDEPLPALINFTAYNKMLNRHGMRANRALRALASRIAPSDRARMTARDVLRTPAGGVLEPFAINRTAVSRGYVGLMVDVRGTEVPRALGISSDLGNSATISRCCGGSVNSPGATDAWR